MIRRIHISWIAILIIMILLTACWDQRLLRDHSLILTIGYDKAENNGIVKTIIFPKNTSGGGGGGQTELEKESEVISVTGDTVKDTEKHMDQKIPEKFDRSKARVIFFGEELATEGIFSTLDSVYRDLRGPLNAKIAIFAGKAKDALFFHPKQALLTSDIYANLLESAEQAGITKNENVQIACPIILVKGKDVVFPYVSVNQEETEAIVEGVALFHDDQMTGTLNIKETSMFLILSDQISIYTALNLKVQDDQEDYNKNFVNIAIRKNKRKINLNVNKDEISADLQIKIEVEIDMYALDQLSDEEGWKKLCNDIESEINKLSEETLGKMQEDNNDSLGLGEKLKAYHHATWENVDWTKEYPDIPIEADFNVEIIRNVITN